MPLLPLPTPEDSCRSHENSHLGWRPWLFAQCLNASGYLWLLAFIGLEGSSYVVQWNEIGKGPDRMSVNTPFSTFLSLMTPLSTQSSVLSNLYHSFNTWFLMVIIKPFSLSTDTNWHIKSFLLIPFFKIMILSYQTLITITVPKSGVNCVSCYIVIDHSDSGSHHVIIFIH